MSEPAFAASPIGQNKSEAVSTATTPATLPQAVSDTPQAASLPPLLSTDEKLIQRANDELGSYSAFLNTALMGLQVIDDNREKILESVNKFKQEHPVLNFFVGPINEELAMLNDQLPKAPKYINQMRDLDTHVKTLRKRISKGQIPQEVATNKLDRMGQNMDTLGKQYEQTGNAINTLITSGDFSISNVTSILRPHVPNLLNLPTRLTKALEPASQN